MSCRARLSTMLTKTDGRETCKRRQTAEQQRMAAVVNEIKARRTAKGSADKPPGGVLIGEHGEEYAREKQQRGRTRIDPDKPETVAPPKLELQKNDKKWV